MVMVLVKGLWCDDGSKSVRKLLVTWDYVVSGGL